MAIFDETKLTRYNQLIQSINDERWQPVEKISSETDALCLKALQNIIKESAQKDDDSSSGSGTQTLTLSKKTRKDLDALSLEILHEIVKESEESKENTKKEAPWYKKFIFVTAGSLGLIAQASTGMGIAGAILILSHTVAPYIVWPVILTFGLLRVLQYLAFDLGRYAKTLGVNYFEAGATLKRRIELFQAMKLFYIKYAKNRMDSIELSEEEKIHKSFIDALFDVHHQAQEDTQQKMNEYEASWTPYLMNRVISLTLLGIQLANGFLAIVPATHLILGLLGISAVAVSMTNPACLIVGTIILLSILAGFYLMYYCDITDKIDGLFGHPKNDYEKLKGLHKEVCMLAPGENKSVEILPTLSDPIESVSQEQSNSPIKSASLEQSNFYGSLLKCNFWNRETETPKKNSKEEDQRLDCTEGTQKKIKQKEHSFCFMSLC